MKDLNLTEEMVLLAVWKLNEDAYGVKIRQRISRETGRSFPYGTLYSTLEKMEKKGFLRMTLGDPLPQRGGRRKHYYSITPAGISALKTALSLRKILWDTETEKALLKS